MKGLTLRSAITPEDLLNIWKGTASVYLRRMIDDPKNRPVMEVMYWQLQKCIEQLEKALSNEYPKIDLLGILANANKPE